MQAWHLHSPARTCFAARRRGGYSRNVLILRNAAAAAVLLFVCATAGLAQSADAPPPSSNGIFPLASVHAGLHGTAWTVFEGERPEPFGVDILGVLHNAQGPGEDMILARLTGAKAEFTGVVAGMSGSPVYIDGKLVGALAFRIGEFSKEPIAGITPIAEMLTVRDLDGRGREGSEQQVASVAAPQATGPIRPIETPLVFSGFSPEALQLWKEHAPALGLEPVAGLGGAQGSSVGPDHAPALEPGSAVSALLVEGDMEIAATCTVTYLEANRLLACGHPLTQFGAVSLPMTKAEIVATLASPAGSFKIVNTGAVVGSFSQDRQTAIGGLVGSAAHMIPVEIAIHGVQGDRTIHLRVLDQAQMTPTAVLVSLYQALQETPHYAEEDSYRVHATVQLAGFAPVQLQTLAEPSALGPATLSAALSVGLRFNALYSSSDRRTPVEGIHIDVDTLRGRHTAVLNAAAIDQTRLHAGDRITVHATVAPYRGAIESLDIPVTLPASLPAGDVRLLVSDGPTLDRLAGAGRASSAPLSSTVEQLNTLHPDDRLYVSLLAPDAEASIDGQALNELPLSVANLLVPAHDRDRGSLHSESIQPLTSVPLDASFTGEQVLTLRVE